MIDRPVDLCEKPEDATVFVDDIVDKGNTRHRFNSLYGNKPFYALVDKTTPECDCQGSWVSFPWERMNNEDAPTENIVRLLQYIGEDPTREGLKETPNRVIRSYETLFGGYKQDPKDVMKVFEDGACDEMVLLKGIPFTSCCEHHMLPFLGRAHIAYIPNGKVIGVSKLARILEIYARRLQIQERIGQQITQCLMEYLKPKGAACILEATHLCMACRGVQKQDSVMITSSLRGAFLDEAMTRSEFMSMIR
jgi:GTP cyclohydrolase I